MKLSKGGIHSVITNSHYWVTTEDDEFLYIDLDFQSYYTFILLKLARKFGFKEFANFIEKLNNDRVVYKKDNPSLSLIYKIMILSVSGNFNNQYNKLYHNPEMYYSMTANGNLLILELISYLQDVISEVINCNTDGVMVKIRKVDQAKLNTLLDSFQKDYDFIIDTRVVYSSGCVITGNDYILREADTGNLKIKGNKKEFNFRYLNEFIIELFDAKLTDLTSINFQSLLDIYMKKVEKDFNKNNLVPYLDRKKMTGKVANPHLYYFYSNSSAATYRLHGGNQLINQHYVERIKPSDDVESFYKYVWSSLDHAVYLYNIVTTLNQNFKLDIRFNLLQLFDYNQVAKDTKSPFYFQNSLLEMWHNFSNLGLKVLPRQANKVQLKNLNKVMAPEYEFLSTLNYLNDDFFKLATLSIINEITFPIVALDFDNVKFLFDRESIPKGLVDFITHPDNVVIYSSPYRNYVRNFKILVKVDTNDFSSLKALKDELKRLNTPFDIEKDASIYGCHYAGLMLECNSPEKLSNLELKTFTRKDLDSVAQCDLVYNYQDKPFLDLMRNFVRFSTSAEQFYQNSRVKSVEESLSKNVAAKAGLGLKAYSLGFIPGDYLLKLLLAERAEKAQNVSLYFECEDLATDTLTECPPLQLLQGRKGYQNSAFNLFAKKTSYRVKGVEIKSNTSYIITEDLTNAEGFELDSNHVTLDAKFHLIMTCLMTYLTTEYSGCKGSILLRSVTVQDPDGGGDFDVDVTNPDLFTKGFKLIKDAEHHCLVYSLPCIRKFDSKELKSESAQNYAQLTEDKRITTMYVSHSKIKFNCYHNACQNDSTDFYGILSKELTDIYLNLKIFKYKAPFVQLNTPLIQAFDFFELEGLQAPPQALLE